MLILHRERQADGIFPIYLLPYRFFHSHVFYRNKRDHIDGAHSRVLSPVSAHINEIDGDAYRFDDGMLQRVRSPYCCYYQPVVVCVSMKVEEFYILLALETCQDFFNSIFVPTFAEIRYCFNDFFHSKTSIYRCSRLPPERVVAPPSKRFKRLKLFKQFEVFINCISFK
jgi:hypothetical protein